MERHWTTQLDLTIEEIFPDMVRLRRQLHACPEPSGEERETSLRVYQLLADAGYRVSMGPDGCGVLADEPGEEELGPRIALRADLDALRIHDVKTCDYRSQRDGVMHACGHDAHTAIVYGALLALSRLRERQALPGRLRVRGLFQPAEETCQGARAMIEVGALDGVEAVLATHVDPARHVGRVGLRNGVLTAHCDEMRITIRGRGGHAARPHETHDPIAAAAHFISSVYQYVPRATDSQEAVVVTFGSIQGGGNPNVIPEDVLLLGTVRSLDDHIRLRTFEHLQRLADGVGRTAGVSIEVEFGRGARAVRNDPGLVELLRRATIEVVEPGQIDWIERPSMGSEDFACYLERIPGAMFRLGCASECAGRSPLHTPTFDIDEEALKIGARILARAALFWQAPLWIKSGEAFA